MSADGSEKRPADAAGSGRSGKRTLVLILVGLLLAGAVAGVAFRDRIEAFLAEMESRDRGAADARRASAAAAAAVAVPVTVMTVQAGSISDILRAVGTLSAEQEIDVTVANPGFIEELPIKEGTWVRKGDLLLTLDAASAAAALADARAQLRLSQQRYDRQKRLADQGYATRKDLEEAQASLETGRASITRTQRAMEERRMLAPFDGTIGRINYSVGAYVTPSNVITTFRALSLLNVDFRVPEIVASRIRLGQVFDVISADAESSIGQGVVTFVAPDIDRATRSVTIRGEIANADLRLRPGQFVAVALSLDEKAGVVVLPLEAFVFALSGTYVFRIRDGKAERVAVKVGIEGDDKAEIVSGIQVGDTVILDGRNQVRHGASVRVTGS